MMVLEVVAVPKVNLSTHVGMTIEAGSAKKKKEYQQEEKKDSERERKENGADRSDFRSYHPVIPLCKGVRKYSEIILWSWIIAAC